MTDLKITIDESEGLRVDLGDAYEGWILRGVEWWSTTRTYDVESRTYVYELGTKIASGLYPRERFETNDDRIRLFAEVEAPDGSTQTLGGYSLIAFDSTIPEGSPLTGQQSRVFGVIDGDISMHFADVVTREGESVVFPLGPLVYSVEVYTAEGETRHHSLRDDGVVLDRGVLYDVEDSHDWNLQDIMLAGDGITPLVTYIEYDEGEAKAAELHHYDEADLLVRHNTLFTDGVSLDVDYDAGVRILSTRSDLDDAHAYDWIEQTYRDGELANTRISYDNGIFSSTYFFANYRGGYFEERQVIDTEDAFAFKTIISFKLDGVMTGRTRYFDEGEWYISEVYDNGVLEYATHGDPNDVFSWREKHVQYKLSDDDPGDSRPVWRHTVYDDGHIKSVSYGRTEDGESVITRSSTHDPSDAHAWNNSETLYDADGQRASSTLNLDDGVVSQTTYIDGVRTVQNLIDPDDARAFASILRTFSDGVITTQVTTLDDERVIERSYNEAGEIERERTVDTADSFVWSDQTTLYTDAEISSRIRLYDNGMRRTDTFENGQRVQVERNDLADVYRWDSILDRFEDGVRVSQAVVLDDDLIG